jgi:hypothetical protein
MKIPINAKTGFGGVTAGLTEAAASPGGIGLAAAWPNSSMHSGSLHGPLGGGDSGSGESIEVRRTAGEADGTGAASWVAANHTLALAMATPAVTNERTTTVMIMPLLVRRCE